MSNQSTDWEARLAAPFDPNDVDFRVLRGNQVAAYVDARVVSERLNQVLGADGWAFTWEPMVVSADIPSSTRKPVNHDVIWVVKGTITIHGVSKSDVGDAGDTEASKAAVSDALKRTAVLWGPGAYLYQLERMTAKTNDRNEILSEEIVRLRKLLPRPAMAPGEAQRPATVSGVPSAPAASQPRTAPPAARGAKVVVGSEIEAELVGQELRRLRDSFSWTNAELLKVARAHVNPDLPKLQDATPAECQALLDVLREKNLAALPEYASIVARPVGAV